MRTRNKRVSLSQILERAQARIDEFGEDESKKKPRVPRRVKKVHILDALLLLYCSQSFFFSASLFFLAWLFYSPSL